MAKKNASKQKKMQTRVDFTPMVDMMMLLITFFMLCTSLSKPQSMQLVMPSRDSDKLSESERQDTKESTATTVYVLPDNQVYYVDGIVDYENPDVLIESGWGSNDKSIRYHLIHKDKAQVDAMMKAKANLDAAKAKDKSMPDSVYDQELALIKKGQISEKYSVDKAKHEYEPLTVILKVSDKASYTNVVDILDEMSFCCINTYMIDDIKDNDKQLLDKKGLKY